MEQTDTSEEAQGWLLITSRASWARLQVAGAWAFAPKHLSKAQAIKPGDLGVVYLTIDRDGMSALGGLVEFAGPCERVSPERVLFDRLYPWRVPIKVVRVLDAPIPFAPFIEELEFITHKSWGSHLQGQPAKMLSVRDFELLAGAVVRGKTGA